MKNPIICAAVVIVFTARLCGASVEDDILEYQKNIKAATANRVSDNPIGEKIISESPFSMKIGDDKIVEGFDRVSKITARLDKLVMMDNTVGKIYPGALLWANDIRDGRLHQLAAINGAPSITVTLSGMTAIPQPLPPAIEVTPQSTADTRSVSFIHNGTYSDYEEKARPIFQKNASVQSRLAVTQTISESTDVSLLKAGLSAKYWRAQMSADLSRSESQSKTVALLTLDQVSFSAVADTPPAEGYLPISLFKNDPQVATNLALASKIGGEPVYVRKVDYGRRILISLATQSQREDFETALNFAVNWAAGNIEGDYSNESSKAVKSLEARIIIIGGEYPEGVGSVFAGNMEGFAKTVKAVLNKKNFEYNERLSAVPVSFELAYAIDNAPMQVYETAEFAGKIPTRVLGKVTRPFRVQTIAGDAKLTKSDDEIHSDDWTLVRMHSQKLTLSEDRRSLNFSLRWEAVEADKDKKNGHKTAIESTKTQSIGFGKPIRQIVSPELVGVGDEWYRGGSLFSFYPFPDHGLLTNIKVRFDASGDHDTQAQSLTADGTVTVWVVEE